MINPEGDLLVNPLKSKTYLKFERHMKGDNRYMSDYYQSFLLGLAFGPIYSMPSLADEIVEITHGKQSSSQSKAGAATGIAFAITHDVWAKARGLGTLGEGRLLLMDYAKPMIRSVPLLPAAYVAAGVLAVQGGIRAHHDWNTYFKHQKSIGTSVGSSYSPKPFWLPLPLWSLFQ